MVNSICIQKLGLSPEDFIKETPVISKEGEITLGFKRTTAFLVDAKTGGVVHTYRSDVAPSPLRTRAAEENALLLVKDTALMKSDAATDLGTVQGLVYITRTDYVLQHYSPNSAEVLWNVAVADIKAEFRCQGLRSSSGGISANADAGIDDIGFPCEMMIPVFRIRDSLLKHKWVNALPRGGAQFLPTADQIMLDNGSPFTHKDSPLALTAPELEAKNLELNAGLVSVADTMNTTTSSYAIATYEAKNLEENTGLVSVASTMNSATLSSGIATKTHMLSVIAAILSIVGSAFYNYFAFRKRSRLNKSVEEFKSEAGVRRKKKSKRSMNNKSNSNDERRQKYLSMENNAMDKDGDSHIKGNERKLFMTFAGVVDGHVDGRKIGKLLVSNKEIAKGSNGTVVLEGIYDGRPVAVKRLVQTHHDVAVKEIQNLIASDQHPNIVRWFGVEHDQDFVYLALERCTCSLNDFIYVNSESFQGRLLSKEVDSILLTESTVNLQSMLDQNRNIELGKPNGHPSTQLLKLMRDMVSGLAHLHELGIIHRDLKPQNVLIINDKSFCAKISDMGISKRLVGDKSSLTHHTTGNGSSGWRAPEQLLQGRQTRAVDLFSLGCVLFFCVTGGKHPFGDNIERDVNIVNDRKDLFLVENIPEAVDLFSQLLDPNPDKRPKAQEVLNHPFFWTHEKRLSFLQDISDRVEMEDRESKSDLLDSLESVGTVALNGKWDEKMEAAFINNIGRYRRYRYDSIRDLLRVIRNKSHHYRELPQEIKDLLGSHPDGFENYFSYRFPKLLIEVYNATYSYCREEEFFRKYIQTSIL
ncbi:serine/threonine-protein kinase/endoribonuclease IRE1b-like isoform X2 [Euphorbia lathyris]|uniref:serine/threonine-protein kinase/endoribonuclease IRE1b-like isoform X2 n=1 Tax=Euphorbia lathyris TaxID=212925 RepID=UPI003313B610